MAFNIEGKVALISGGASGIGLKYAKELLRNGLKGVTLADVNTDFGNQALKEIEKEFGSNKAVFVHTDVTNKQSFEEAFKKTIDVFKNLDILINNAGIFNDAIWEKEIAININGVVHGILLGLEHYIPKFKTADEGVIVNIASVAGITPSGLFPIYSATKYAVLGMSKAFGNQSHYSRTGVRTLTLCPGLTRTPMVTGMSECTLGPNYKRMVEKVVPNIPIQNPESVAVAMIHIIKHAATGTIWVAENDEEPYEYKIPPRENFAPK